MEFISINIGSKKLNYKKFKIKLSAKLEIVKQLILARLKTSSNIVKFNYDECYFSNDNNIRLDNDKTVQQLCNNNLIHDNCRLFLNLVINNHKNQNIDYNNSAQFSNINMSVKHNIAQFWGIPIPELANMVVSQTPKLFSNQVGGVPGWYDESEYSISWSDSDINDDDW